MTFVIGFTGTRYSMTADQWWAVCGIIADVYSHDPFEAHHGDCIGADAEFHHIVRVYKHCKVTIHPGPANDAARQAGCRGDEHCRPRPHMVRNKNIVLASSVMIGAPRQDQQQEFGGTWRTVGMARDIGRPLALVLPSGQVIKERWLF